MATSPSYDSRGLVNLIAEIEHRLTGEAVMPRLDSSLTSEIPDAETIVLLLFDGLGTAQLDHPAARTFRDSKNGTLEVGFPSTTSTSLATVSTGLAPSQHGVVAHLMWMPEHEKVVNTLKWVDLAGLAVAHDYPTLLPRPNLWERLRGAGAEPITVQPEEFRGTPLTRVLYRGARFEGVWGIEDLIDATVQLASEPGRLIFTYVPDVDFAGHVYGLTSPEFGTAMSTASRVWEEVSRRLPPGAALLGTADHGLIEYDDASKLLIRDPRFDRLRFAGDTRGLHVWGDEEAIEELVESTGGRLCDPLELLGPSPTPDTRQRLGQKLILAPDGVAILPRGFDKRLRAYHGGVHRDELEVPLLIG